jgi:hypothetical protein
VAEEKEDVDVDYEGTELGGENPKVVEIETFVLMGFVDPTLFYVLACVSFSFV